MSRPTAKNSSPARTRARSTHHASAADVASVAEGSARDRLIATARRLFYQEGPRAVGIDRVLAESGVAKMSLYRHFGSKEALILACLEEHEHDYWKLWEERTAPAGATAVEQLRNSIRFIALRTSDPAYQGCIFLNTAQSFPDAAHPAHCAAVKHKTTLAKRLRELCTKAGAKHPAELAQQLVLLINGAQATAGMLGRETQMSIVAASEALFRAQGIAL